MKHSDYIEDKPRGSADFPIQIYKVSKEHPEYVMPLHWHRELEIVRVISGSFELYVNNTPYSLYPGDIAFVNCRDLHRGAPDNCCYECIVLDLSMLVKKGNNILSSYINPIISGELQIQTLLHSDGSKLYAVINSLFSVLKGEDRYYELATFSLLFGLLEQLHLSGMITRSDRSKKTAGQTAAVADLVRWIDNNHTEHITLPILAGKAGMTPNYLCRIFKEYTGKTPIEYVNSVRIDNVCYEISQGQRNITTAATNNGYNDLSYFCKVFKRHKGVSAKTYVNNCKIT